MTCHEIAHAIESVFQAELEKRADYAVCFDSILIGCQNACHDIYPHLQSTHPFHLLPTDFGNESVRINSVVSYAIVFTPHTEVVTNSFSPQTWVEATFLFRALSTTINERVRALADMEAVIIPRETPCYARIDTGEAFLSSWSERHMAYTCGLGTFGLHHALITEKGCQVRLSSLVTSAICDIPVSPLKGIYDHCLYYANGSCRRCVALCPVGAIGAEKKDMMQCYHKEDVINTAYNAKQYGRPVPTCGLCMIGVPCSTGIPVSPRIPAQTTGAMR